MKWLVASQMHPELNELSNAYAVDMAIQHETDRVVVVRFGRSNTAACTEMDELLASTMVRLSRMAIFYIVDRDVVPGFDVLYELEDDDFALLFYCKGRRMQCDFGRYGKYKLTVVPPSTDTFIDVITELYYNAQLGRFICTSPWQS
ncbi:Mitosis protein dim1 [Giardia duodenalis]|uniref:Mitosis protein dim1 n=2 Tax=Giardia intestinalis TaxID=5741 RepID=V6TYL6_GIAIN|nr:Mitosis protein dim1 [Giardia intestinalis]